MCKIIRKFGLPVEVSEPESENIQPFRERVNEFLGLEESKNEERQPADDEDTHDDPESFASFVFNLLGGSAMHLKTSFISPN